MLLPMRGRPVQLLDHFRQRIDINTSAPVHRLFGRIAPQGTRRVKQSLGLLARGVIDVGQPANLAALARRDRPAVEKRNAIAAQRRHAYRGVTMPTRLSGSAAEIDGPAARRPARRDVSAVARPPRAARIVRPPRRRQTARRGSRRASPAGDTRAQARATAARAIRAPAGRGTSRRSDCSSSQAQCSARSSLSTGCTNGGNFDQRPPCEYAAFATPPLAARAACADSRASRFAAIARTAAKPSDVTRPSAASSRSASSSCDGNKLVAASRSSKNSAPCVRQRFVRGLRIPARSAER